MNKLDLGFDNLLEKFVLLAVFFFPVLIVLVKSGGTSIFGVMVLLSLYVFFRKAIKQDFTRDEKLVFYSLLLFFLLAMFISLISGFDKAAWKSGSRFLNLLFAIPLYFLFKTYLRKTVVVWWGLLAGIVFCGFAAIYEFKFGSYYFEGNFFPDRAKGVTHPILFADISLSMGVMFLMGLSTIKKWNNKLSITVLLVVFFCLAAVILSKSRGPLIILPVLVLMLIWQVKARFSKKASLITMSMISIVAVVIYLIPVTGVQQRIDSTFSNIQKYTEGTHKTTSVGTRFEMWKASWLIIKKQPVLGVGWGNYQETAQKLVDQGKVNKIAAAWNNPHSQYFSALVNGGLITLFALLILFLVPMSMFKKLLVFGDREVRAYALAGIALIVGYMGYAFSESIFERTIPTAFFAFYLAMLFALANRAKEEKSIAGVQRAKKLSVIIIAFNEADRIGECLASVSGWADEVVLFDNGSTDGTIEIAKKYTDKVFVTDWPGYGKQKQRALENAQYEWVLSLDADEKLTPELRSEIDTALSSESNNVAYKIPLALILYNKRLDFGLYTRDHLRLFKREGARFTDATVHESIVIQKGNVGLLRERFLHYSYRDLKHAVEKFNQNAWLWGTERFAKGKRAFWFSAIIHAIWKFISGYIIRLGFLDGFRGLIMAVHAAMYTFNKYAVLWTLNLQEKNND